MKRALLTLVCIAAAVGGAWILVRSPRTDSAPRTATTPARNDVEPATRPSSGFAGSATASRTDLLPATPTETPRPPTPGSSRVDARVESSAVGWVEGHVTLPGDVPADEVSSVVVAGLSFNPASERTARVRDSGHFRITVPKHLRKPMLSLRARYLYLESRHPLSASIRSGTPVRLEPKLGGHIHGTVRAHELSPEERERVVGSVVQLAGTEKGKRFVRRAMVRPDLSYEIGGIPAEHAAQLTLDPGPAAPVAVPGVLVTAGASRRLDIELGPGVRLSGTVRDTQGQTVWMAKIRATSKPKRTQLGGERVVKSRTKGVFSVQGLHEGRVTLDVEAAGYRPHQVQLGYMDAGYVANGIEIVLDRGETIRGRVRWPNGRPGARVNVRASRPEARAVKVRADEDGTFALGGLAPGSYRVEASAPIQDGKKRRVTSARRRGNLAYAAQSNVPAGEEDLDLLLNAGVRVLGHVIDDVDTPVAASLVTATPSHLESVGRTSARSVRSTTANDGSFEMKLDQGSWSLTATPKLHSASEPVIVEVLPTGVALGSHATLILRVVRNPQLQGTVLTPDGTPLANAEVFLRSVEGNTIHQNFRVRERRAKVRRSKTDSIGRFVMDDVPVGRVALQARAEGHGASAIVELEAAAATPIDKVELHLNAYGRVTGVLLESDGGPAPKQRVEITGPYQLLQQTAETDEQGTFAFDSLGSGIYYVSTDLGLSGAEVIRYASSDIEVFAGQTSHVVLRQSELSVR